MHKSKYAILFLLTLIQLVFVTGCLKEEDSKYPSSGKDTVEQFGDGRFVVLTGISPLGNKRYYCLYDREGYGEQIEGNVLAYSEYGECIYAIGLNGKLGQYEEYDDAILKLDELPDKIIYTEVNYVNGELVQSENISDFDSDAQEKFEQLLKGQTLYE